MTVTYDNIAYNEIELALRTKLSTKFQNVYIGSEFKMLGTECIKIELIDSSLVLQNASLEQREYGLTIRYYFKADISQEIINKSIKSKIDKLRKHLLDNQVNTTNNWAELRVENIIYNVQDEENEEENNLHIAEYDVVITHNNVYT
jgi:hypothetical protein